MSSNVLRTIRVMMKYSKGEETTILHTLYLKLALLLGIYLSRGRASIVKSIHDFWKRKHWLLLASKQELM